MNKNGIIFKPDGTTWYQGELIKKHEIERVVQQIIRRLNS